jgi:hypothetical protein
MDQGHLPGNEPDGSARCWCGFYFDAMNTRILQFFYDQFALLRHGLDRCLGQGWYSAHFKMIF